MTEEEKETIKYIESGIDTYIENTKVTKIVISEEQAKILLNIIQKQEKIIDKIAERYYSLYKNIEVVRDSFDMSFGKFLKSKEEVIEYFERQVEENE